MYPGGKSCNQGKPICLICPSTTSFPMSHVMVLIKLLNQTITSALNLPLALTEV